MVIIGLLGAVALISGNQPISFASSSSKLPVNVYDVTGLVHGRYTVSVINSSNVITKLIKLKGKNNPEAAEPAFCGNKIFVSDDSTVGGPPSGNISVISPTKNKIIKTISGIVSPGPLLCVGKLLWITDSDSNFLRIMNSTTYKIVENISDDSGVLGYSPDTKAVYVSNGTAISEYNSSTFEHLKTITLQDSGIFAYDPINKDMYLTNEGGIFPRGASIFMISPSNVVTEYNFSSSNCYDHGGTTGIAYSPATREMYVSCAEDDNDQGSVMVLNATTNAVKTTVTNFGGFDTGSMVFDPSNNNMYVVNFENTNDKLPPVVAVISTANQVVATIPVSYGEIDIQSICVS